MRIISKIIDIIHTLLKFILKSWQNFLIFALILLGLFLYFKWRSAESEIEKIKIETTDSLTTYKNKIGELYSQRSTDVLTIKELRAKNTELYNEVKNLKDNPIVVTKIKYETKIKEIVMHDTAYIDTAGVYSFPMKYSDQWCRIDGRSTINTNTMTGTAKIDSLSIPNTITVDLIEKNKQLSFIVKSDNPYCKINNVIGSVISPENSSVLKKRFDKKWVVAAGIGPTLTYTNDKLKIVPGIQITVGRKLFGF